MDQDAFRKTYRDINDRFCLFEKSILSGQCACAQASRFYLAEREGVHCRSDRAQKQCEDLLRGLRRQARFALRSSDETGALPHAKAMRIQVGGLRGLHISVYGECQVPLHIGDIYDLINRAVESFGSLDDLPYQVIIKQVAAYQGRRRGRRK